MQQRLQKLIASAGLTSRRHAEQWIQAGRVCVNGVPATLGATADPATDEITVNGVPLAAPPQLRYLLLYKPRGFVTTCADERGRRTVQDLLKDVPVRVFPVGRLDQASEGLLLLTNDGALAQKLMHPSHCVEKTYLVWVTGFYPGAVAVLQQPIVLDGRKIAKPEVRCLWQRDGAAQLEITIHEGRNRQIRRMCEAANLHANRLKRIQEGNLRLGTLAPGTWRDLTADEIADLKKV